MLMTPKQKTEFAKCKINPIYFLNNYFKIRHFSKGCIDFDLYNYQRHMLKEFTFNKNIFNSTSRQIGTTTLSLGYATWYALFNPNSNITLVTKTLDESQRHIIDFGLESVPDFLKPNIKRNNKYEIDFSNDAKIRFLDANPDLFRGHVNDVVIMDQFAYYKNQSEILSAIIPSMSDNYKLIINSTPASKEFERLMKTTLDEYTSINQYPWYFNDNLDKDFMQRTISQLGINAWKQQWQCEFLPEPEN